MAQAGISETQDRSLAAADDLGVMGIVADAATSSPRARGPRNEGHLCAIIRNLRESQPERIRRARAVRIRRVYHRLPVQKQPDSLFVRHNNFPQNG